MATEAETVSETSASFADASYRIQTRHEEDVSQRVPNVLGAPGKIDAWRHDRMYDSVSVLYRHFASRSWLTIGDSGADAVSLKRRGVRRVVASCLSRARLDYLSARGLMDGVAIREVNAEDSGVDDESVDFVFCKEAYHHFPRPPVAFYELLRIARDGVVYIEPQTENRERPLDRLRRLAKRVLRRQADDHQEFEPAGNYIFRVSPQEFVRMATALQLDVVAYRYFNDFFVLKIADQERSNRAALAFVRAGLAVQGLLCRLKLMSWGFVSIVVFKESPSEELLADMERNGFEVVRIPKNPYLSSKP